MAEGEECGEPRGSTRLSTAPSQPSVPRNPALRRLPLAVPAQRPRSRSADTSFMFVCCSSCSPIDAECGCSGTSSGLAIRQTTIRPVQARSPTSTARTAGVQGGVHAPPPRAPRSALWLPDAVHTFGEVQRKRNRGTPGRHGISSGSPGQAPRALLGAPPPCILIVACPGTLLRFM